MKRIECDVRMRILLAAKKLFAQQGYDATTVRQICKEAKSNLALVSYHFGGKESVFFALFDTFFPADILSTDLYTDHPVEGLRQIVERLVQFKLQQPEMVTIIQQEIIMNSPRLEAMSKYIYPVYTRLREFLYRGQEQKLFHFKSVSNTIRFIIAVINYPVNNTFINTLTFDREQSYDETCEDTIKFIFDGIGCGIHDKPYNDYIIESALHKT